MSSNEHQSSSSSSSKEQVPKVDQQQQQQVAPTKQGIVRVKFYLYVEMCENNLQLENHIKRLQNLRKELTFIKDTDWQYESMDKFFGQS